jgi:hypothetical protein
MQMTFENGALPMDRSTAYDSWESYADARAKGFKALESSIEHCLTANGTVRESLGSLVVDWTWNGSKACSLSGMEVVSHLVSRYLGFGTSLQLIPQRRN